MWNFGNILIGSPQLNVAVVGQGNGQVAGNVAGLAGFQGIGQLGSNASVIQQTNYVG